MSNKNNIIENKNSSLELKENDLPKQQLEENNKKEKKSKKVSIIMFIINILIVLGILLYNITQNSEFTPLRELSIDINYLIVILFITFLTIFIDSLITNLFLKTADHKGNLPLAYKSFSIMRYYDSITPMGAGGQPLMATYLMRNDISGSKAVSVPVKKFLTQQFSWLIITSVGLVYTIVNKTITSPLILFFAIFGFTINLFLDSFILIGSASEKISKGVSIWFLNLLKKLHIIKNYDKALEKTTKFMEEYQLIMKEFSDNKKEFFGVLLMGVVKNFLYFCIPFFIYCCFETIDFNLFLQFFTFTVMVELSASCFPLPGGSGMNEITFSVLFTTYLPRAVFWAMLLWRFASYYILIIQGIGIMAYDLIPKKDLNNQNKLEKNK